MCASAAHPRRLPQRRLRHPCAGAASAPSGRSRHARSRRGRDLCLLGHHRLFRHQESHAAAARRAGRAGGRRRARAAGDRGAEGAGPPRHRRGRHQRREARAPPSAPARTATVDGAGDGRANAPSSRPAAAQPLAIIDLVNGTATARARVRRAAQGRQADPGRPVRRRTYRAAAADADPRADPPGQLCRQPQGTARTGRARPGRASWRRCRSTTVPQNQANEALMRLRAGRVTGRLVLKAEAA